MVKKSKKFENLNSLKTLSTENVILKEFITKLNKYIQLLRSEFPFFWSNFYKNNFIEKFDESLIDSDKAKKTIFYEHATLKVYDIPIFYFPRFFHPDPTVKRQSGFLMPTLTNSTTVGTGLTTPYYWAISNDKDLTFTPKFYNQENLLFLNEYRQAFNNAFLILDTSYTQGYKETTSKKNEGSRSHFFGELDINLADEKPYQSNLSLKVQKATNDTYFKVHNIFI